MVWVSSGVRRPAPTSSRRTLAPLAAGHLVSIAVVLLPFAALTLVLDWNREIRIGAGLGIIPFAVLLLMSPRHPRWMTGISPRQVALWSFAVALLHGAGLTCIIHPPGPARGIV